jgi:O-antigen ligase
MIWLLGGYMWLFVHRPFEYWPWLGTLQIERVYMLLAVAWWAAAPGKGCTSNRLHLTLLLQFLILCVAWAASPYRDNTVEVLENSAKVAVFYLLVVTAVRDEAGLRRLLLLFCWAVGLYLAHSLLEYLHGRYQYRMGTRRLIGVDTTYSDPNAFAATLVYSLPLTLPLWLTRPTGKLKFLLVCFTGGACVAVLLTGSRSGLIGLFILGLVCVWQSPRRKLLLSLTAAAAIVGFAALPEDRQNRYLTILDSSYGPKNAQVSAEDRMAGLLAGVKAWTESPLLGHGPGSFAAATHRKLGAHNLYGQALCEVGVAGVLALLLTLWAFWANGREVRRLYAGRPPDLAYHVCRAVNLTVLMLLLLGWSGHNLLRYHWMWAGAFQAVAVHCARRKAAEGAPPPARLPYLVGPRRVRTARRLGERGA